MKYIKTYENKLDDATVKEGDYVVFNDDYVDEVSFVKKHYPYEVKYVAIDVYHNLIAYIDCDDGEEKSFKAINSSVYKKISKKDAEILLNANKYNL